MTKLPLALILSGFVITFAALLKLWQMGAAEPQYVLIPQRKEADLVDRPLDCWHCS